MDNLRIKIASTQEEIKAAQALRYEVFINEFQSETTPPHSNGFDQDSFDQHCDHLIIIDTNSNNKLIGTYRMLLGSTALKTNGFYSATKFNIDSITRLPGNLLEVGRSCVHKDYRNRTVLNLLWQGICNYCIKNNVRYIFGSASIMSNDPIKVSQFFMMFKALGIFQDMGIRSIDEAHRIELCGNIQLEDPKRLFNELPTLFKGYMKVGLKVCGYPARGFFNSALFPVLLDIKNTSPLYKKKFFGDYLSEGAVEEPAYQEAYATV